MAPPNNPLVVRAAIIMQRDTRQIVNTFHVSKPDAWTMAELVALAGSIHTWWSTYYKIMVPNTIALVQIQLRVYNPSVPLAYDLNISPPEVGTRGTTTEPANATLSLSERTGLAGRKYRGRMYLGGLDSASTNQNDTVTSALVTLAAGALANLIVGALPAPLKIALFHRGTNTFTEVVAYVIENVIDSQRRRLPGRGR